MNWLRVGVASLLCVFVSISAVGEEAKRAVTWGINGHPFQSYPGVTIREQLDYVEDLGLNSYRVDVGSLDRASGLRYLVAEAQLRGIDILPVLTPPVDLEKDSPAGLYDKAFAFAAWFVSRFKDSIRVWELGNELENYAILQPCEMQDDGIQYNCSWW